MLPMTMFRSYDIVATDFATMTSGMIMLGIFYFVAIFFVIVGGNDPVSAGSQLLYFAPGMVSELKETMLLLIFCRVLAPRSRSL